MLVFIKLLHSVAWALLAGCVVCVPLFTYQRRFRAAKIVSTIVWIECLVILLNHGRCPLTDVAARYTSNRAPNFDIYLPLWLAQYNKLIFGTFFFLGETYRLTLRQVSNSKIRKFGDSKMSPQSRTTPYSLTTPRSSNEIANHSDVVPMATRSGPSQ
jgi:hypothetical protein